MAVLQGYIEGMALNRQKYLDKWDGSQATIMEHIIKLALIIDDNNQNKWKGEIEAQVSKLAGYKTKSRISHDTFIEVYDDHCYENQVDIGRHIGFVIDGYCDDESNADETACVREWETRLIWVETKINEIFKRCVELVEAHYIEAKDFKKGTLAKDQTIKNLLGEFHAIKEYKVWKHRQVIRESK